MTRPDDWINETRTKHGKRWERPPQGGDPAGHRRYQLDMSMRAAHVPDSVKAQGRGDPFVWEDTDIVWHPTTNHYREGNAYFRIVVKKNQIGYLYTSRTEGEPFVELILTHVGTTFINPSKVPVAEIRGNQLWWVDVTPGVDLYLVLRADGVEMRKRINTVGADRSFKWEVTETNPLPLTRQQISKGHDNHDLSEPSRANERPGNRRREIELTNIITPMTGGPSTETWYTIDETWTGNTWVYDEDRVKSLSTDFVLPIDIDVLVEEEISASSNDGFGGDGLGSAGAHWDSNGWLSTDDILVYDWDDGAHYFAGWRFITVPIPKDATIDDATFSVGKFENEPFGGTLSSRTLHGSAEDDAAIWNASNRPDQRTAVGSGTSVDWYAASDGTDVDVDVATTIGEITSRAGWLYENSLALFDRDSGPASDAGSWLEDEEDADPAAGRLVVNYTSSVPIVTLPTEADITETTATIGCTTDTAAGTLYAYVSTSATAPSVSDLKDGTGSVDFDSQASPGVGIETFAITGLSADTSYYSYFLHNEGGEDSSIRPSGIWATHGTEPQLSLGTATDITRSTATVGCTTNTAGGTLYWYVKGTPQFPSVANLKAGIGATDYGNIASPGIGAETFAAEGFTPDDSWYSFFVHNEAGEDSAIYKAPVWFTSEGIDTKARRMNMLSFASPLAWQLHFEEDGSIDADDRTHLLHLYGGNQLDTTPVATGRVMGRGAGEGGLAGAGGIAGRRGGLAG